ncbi:MAG: 50S ribosomal protein L2 [Nitrososphaerales archaeon]
MGKRILVQRRGRGGKQFRAAIANKIVPAKYPTYPLEEHHIGEVVDIVHESGRDAPLAKVRFDDNKYAYFPATEGTYLGARIEIGRNSPVNSMNVMDLNTIPDGTTICNIERNFGDGGKLVKAAGSSAIVFAHAGNGVTLRMPSRKFLTLNPKCRAVVGVIAGGGKGEKPFLMAGNKFYALKAKGKTYPKVRGIAMAAVYHPYGGGRHQHPGKQTSVGRTAPPGRKVGNIAPKKTGTTRIRRI